MPDSADARSPRALLDEVDDAREVLVLTYTASLEYFEHFVLADARALGAKVTVISDAAMVHPDPVVVRRAGVQYLDARVVCPGAAFHPKLLAIVGTEQARIAIGSGNLTLAGWHANAELWTVLRSDGDGGPDTVRQVAAFLRDLGRSSVSFGPGATDALERVAERLDGLPADDPGPRLLHSLHRPIVDQLPEVRADELTMYAPFHDRALAGAQAVLDRLRPSNWTALVDGDTDVDGAALAALAEERGGRLAWIEGQGASPGRKVPGQRYWHGKLIEWQIEGTRVALTGSPNLSTTALRRTVGAGGNCELALLDESGPAVAPPQSEPPAGGVVALTPAPRSDDVPAGGIVILSATLNGDMASVLLLSERLSIDATLERYDVDTDQWRRSTTLAAGQARYELPAGMALAGDAVRIVPIGEMPSNGVFVTDLQRVRTPHVRAIGKARATPAEIVRLGLGDQLLADIDELRAHLVRVGARLPPSGVAAGDDAQPPADEQDGPPTRAAPGLTLEEYLAACEPVLGHSLTEFALVLPVLPGTGTGVYETGGVLDEGEVIGQSPEQQSEAPSLSDELRDSSERERERYRRFLERLVARAAGYPMVVRGLAVRSVLHAQASHVWAHDRALEQLAAALGALGEDGDEPNEHDRAALAALAAVGLAVLRESVERMSRRDEHALRYLAAGRSVAWLLDDVPPDKVEMLAAELPGRLAGASSVLAVERAVEETIRPPTGAARVARLLVDDHRIAATALDGETVELLEPVGTVPEARLLAALALADGPGPVRVQGHMADRRAVTAAWCFPWLAIERTAPAGPVGRAWKLAAGQSPATLQWDDLPKATETWFGGALGPAAVVALLGPRRSAG